MISNKQSKVTKHRRPTVEEQELILKNKINIAHRTDLDTKGHWAIIIANFNDSFHEYWLTAYRRLDQAIFYCERNNIASRAAGTVIIHLND